MAGLAFAALWLRLGVPVRRRVQESIALGAVAGGGVLGQRRVVQLGSRRRTA